MKVVCLLALDSTLRAYLLKSITLLVPVHCSSLTYENMKHYKDVGIHLLLL